jgi:hypothetical protein
MARMSRESLRWLWTVVAILLGVGALAGYAFYRADQAQRDLCDFVVALYADPDNPRPETDLGRRRDAAARHYLDRRCR